MNMIEIGLFNSCFHCSFANIVVENKKEKDYGGMVFDTHYIYCTHKDVCKYAQNARPLELEVVNS